VRYGPRTPRPAPPRVRRPRSRPCTAGSCQSVSDQAADAAQQRRGRSPAGSGSRSRGAAGAAIARGYRPADTRAAPSARAIRTPCLRNSFSIARRAAPRAVSRTAPIVLVCSCNDRPVGERSAVRISPVGNREPPAPAPPKKEPRHLEACD
jgi:hypothetical protein